MKMRNSNGAQFSFLHVQLNWFDVCAFHSISSDEIYIAPSGVQKERILPEDLFIQNIDGEDIQVPPEYKK